MLISYGAVKFCVCCETACWGVPTSWCFMSDMLVTSLNGLKLFYVFSYCWYLVSSWNQRNILRWKWILIFVRGGASHLVTSVLRAKKLMSSLEAISFARKALPCEVRNEEQKSSDRSFMSECRSQTLGERRKLHVCTLGRIIRIFL